MLEDGSMWDNRMSTWRMEKKEEAERQAAKLKAKEGKEKKRKRRTRGALLQDSHPPRGKGGRLVVGSRSYLR
jgi:hypothetical protein